MNYDLCGNLIPIWPGGNIARGMQYCFDIPDIYFNQDNISQWVRILQAEYNNSFFEGIVGSIFAKSTEEFLNKMDEDSYKDFLVHCVSVIKDRTERMEAVEKELKKVVNIQI